ncbi:MAG TPA: hypothetical protein VI408_06860 [Gaiellaceae bacterium]
MTELVQPLAAAPAVEQSRTAAAPPQTSFADLVHAHFEWLRAARQGDGPLAASYHRVRNAFEEQHGRIVHAYWCSHVASAVALTEMPRKHWWQHKRLVLHRESDWATKQHFDIAAEIHRCDELAVRAEAVLTGVRHRICMQLISASAAHLLSIVDGGEMKDEKEVGDALSREREVLEKTGAYYRAAANGQAQIAYFAGMATVTTIIAGLAALVLALHWVPGVASLIAGAIGAVVSVVQRINSRDFDVDYDVGRPYAFFLGGLRPLIGGALALAISFAFLSGIMHLPLAKSESNAHHHLALVVISFVAGFSERWAQDTLATAIPQAVAPHPATTTTEVTK